MVNKTTNCEHGHLVETSCYMCEHIERMAAEIDGSIPHDVVAIRGECRSEYAVRRAREIVSFNRGVTHLRREN